MLAHHLLPALGLFAWAGIMAWAFQYNRRKWRASGKTVINGYGEVDKEWAYRTNLASCVLFGVVAVILGIVALTAGFYPR